MEVIELDIEKHPYFVAAQFHPDLRPNPLFLGLLNASKVAAAGEEEKGKILNVCRACARYKMVTKKRR